MGVQDWLWYRLPTKYLTDEPGYVGRLAGVAAELFDELELDGYAALCSSEATPGVHAAFDRSDAAGFDALIKAMEASGIRPPDLDDFEWASSWGSRKRVVAPRSSLHWSERSQAGSSWSGRGDGGPIGAPSRPGRSTLITREASALGAQPGGHGDAARHPAPRGYRPPGSTVSTRSAPRPPRFGPERWRRWLSGWSLWDLWFCVIAVADHDGDLGATSPPGLPFRSVKIARSPGRCWWAVLSTVGESSETGRPPAGLPGFADGPGLDPLARRRGRHGQCRRPNLTPL